MVTQLGAAESRSGDGRLGAVVFERIAAGDSAIRIVEAGLLDNSIPEPMSISVSLGDISAFNFQRVI